MGSSASKYAEVAGHSVRAKGATVVVSSDELARPRRTAAAARGECSRAWQREPRSDSSGAMGESLFSPLGLTDCGHASAQSMRTGGCDDGTGDAFGTGGSGGSITLTAATPHLELPPRAPTPGVDAQKEQSGSVGSSFVGAGAPQACLPSAAEEPHQTHFSPPPAIDVPVAAASRASSAFPSPMACASASSQLLSPEGIPSGLQSIYALAGMLREGGGGSSNSSGQMPSLDVPDGCGMRAAVGVGSCSFFTVGARGGGAAVAKDPGGDGRAELLALVAGTTGTQLVTSMGSSSGSGSGGGGGGGAESNSLPEFDIEEPEAGTDERVVTTSAAAL